MKKTTVLWIILDLIFLIIFNAVFYILGGTEHNVSVWLSYGFIHIAYVLLLLTPVLTRNGKNVTVFGLSLVSISTTYFIISFIIGIVFILVAADDYKATLLVQLCIAGLYGVILISNMLANERTAITEEIRQNEIANVKDASVRLKGLMNRITEKDTKNSIERAYDAVHSSPAKSHPGIAQIEHQILQSINELEEAVTSGNKGNIISCANSILMAVNERNMRLKSLN